MYKPFTEDADVQPMTQEELDEAAKAAEELATHRFQMEER